MKTFLLIVKHVANTMPVLWISIVLLIASPHAKCFAGKPFPLIAGDSIFIQKNITSRSPKISLYPAADQNVLFFGVRGAQGKLYQLFLFDLEGRLVKQSEVRNKQTTLIKEMEKGNYLFEVFSDDVRIENGQITVR